MTFRTLRTMNLFENFDLIIIIFASFKFGSVRFGLKFKENYIGSVSKLFGLFRLGSKKTRTDPTSGVYNVKRRAKRETHHGTQP